MILLLGDIHGNLSVLERCARVAQETGASALIQVGDFGISPERVEKLMGLRWPIPIFFIDGNHDHFESLGDMSESIEFGENLFYVPRGTIVEIDSLKIGFMGGAGSVDKHIRQKEGWYWSGRENILRHEMERMTGDVDVLVTHCPPQSIIQKHFDPRSLEYMFGLPRTWRDPNADLVEELWVSKGRPPLYCGHMHRSVRDGNVAILDVNELVVMLESEPEAAVEPAPAGGDLGADEQSEVPREDR